LRPPFRAPRSSKASTISARTLTTGPAEAFFAGDDRDAKTLVMDLAGKMGFRPHDAGPLRNASLIENLAVLWIQLASTEGAGRQFAFRLEKQA
jgi:predicted dinucleotide-binding enzyme